jgi:hypothetical protein
MKENWSKLLNKSTLDVIFFPDIVYTYYILHNLIIRKGTLDMDICFAALVSKRSMNYAFAKRGIGGGQLRRKAITMTCWDTEGRLTT